MKHSIFIFYQKILYILKKKHIPHWQPIQTLKGKKNH